MTCSEVACFLHEEGNNNDLLSIDGRARVALKAIGNDRANRAVVENPLLGAHCQKLTFQHALSLPVQNVHVAPRR